MRKPGDENWVKVNDDEVFTTSYTIKGKLEPGQAYEFKIEATNEAGLTSNSNLPSNSVVCPSSVKGNLFFVRIDF